MNNMQSFAGKIQQGHLYDLGGSNVVALDSGESARVMHFRPEEPWHGLVEVAHAHQLVAKPMKYFHGEVPK
jgi:hypothetical protein